MIVHVGAVVCLCASKRGVSPPAAAVEKRGAPRCMCPFTAQQIHTCAYVPRSQEAARKQREEAARRAAAEARAAEHRRRVEERKAKYVSQ